jgi:hypothetical protein
MNPVGDLNIEIIHKKSIPIIAKLISTVPDSNVKICRLCEKKTTDILYTCAVTVNILSKYLVGLNYRKFLFRTLC